MGMIEQIRIAAMGEGEDEYTAPPARILDLAVIGEDADIDIYDTDPAGKTLDKPAFSVRVPARSLAIALNAAIEESNQS
ncbi:hypothetical protein [Actinopolymorpha pittospori]|uniref:Uncharacterized protein n=1 Tax=Actinopolymorpha pittospori TaxID=648752 RepID=A0A927N7K6_9ACTN|nr:hypothetical protein [Actinopolymorpha pittospori]MBE1609925.1 hypothetical protein [Actinopolymorpha pittospori]